MNSNIKKKILMLSSLTLVLFAGLVAVAFAIYNSQKEGILSSFKFGSVDTVLSSDNDISNISLKGSTPYKVNLLVKNNSTRKFTPTIKLAAYDKTTNEQITGDRLVLIQDILYDDEDCSTKTSSSIHVNEIIIEKEVDKGNVASAFRCMRADNSKAKEIGNFYLKARATTSSYYEFTTIDATSTDELQIFPGDTVNISVGKITSPDTTQNKEKRPLIARVKLSGSYNNNNDEAIILDYSKFDIDEKYNSEKIWIQKDDSKWYYEESSGYYYYKGVLTTGQTTESIIKQIVFGKGAKSNTHQDDTININYNVEFIDSDPTVRPEDWPTDETLGITDNPGEIKMSITNCPGTIEVGKTAQLTLSTTPANIKDSATWNSSATGILSVDKNGKITGVATGTATITATGTNNHTATCNISVEKASDIEVTGVSISTSKDKIKVGETLKLTATITPSNATNQMVTWDSSDEEILRIDNENNKEISVVGLKPGTATITVIAGSGKSATRVITVEQQEITVDSITLNKTKLELTKGNTEKLTALVLPEGAIATKTWSSSNSNVATVDQDGNVTAINEGTATIIVTAGGKQASCIVTVNPIINTNKAVKITVNPTSKTLDIGKGETVIISSSVTGEDSSKPSTDKVIYTSDNTSVATVDSNTGKVVPKTKGVAVITAKAGNVSAKATITVINSKENVESISLSKKELNLKVGEAEKVIVTLTPTDSETEIIFGSNDSSIAKVEKSGKDIIITGTGEGIATITVSAGGKYTTLKVTVTNSNETPSADPGDNGINKNGTTNPKTGDKVVAYVAVSLLSILLITTTAILITKKDVINSKCKKIIIISIIGLSIALIATIIYLASTSFAYFVEDSNELIYNVTVEYDETLKGDWEYYECGSDSDLCPTGTIYITGYNGSEVDLTLPTEIDGKTVTGITSPNKQPIPGMNQVTSLVIPEGYLRIGDYTFNSYSKLNSVSLPNSLESIGESAFEGTGINSITLPTSLKNIIQYAFKGTKITSIVIPSSVQVIESGVFWSTPIENVTVKGRCGLGEFSNSGGLGELSNSKVTIEYPDCKFTYTACDSLTTAQKDESGCESGTNVITGFTEESTLENRDRTIPTTINGKYVSSVYNMGEALTNLAGNTNVRFKSDSKVSAIGAGAFKGTESSKKVTTIILPSSLKTIYANAFSYTKFSTITIPASVETIAGRNLFLGNTNLKTINIEGKCSSDYSVSWNTLAWGSDSNYDINWNGTNCN